MSLRWFTLFQMPKRHRLRSYKGEKISEQSIDSKQLPIEERRIPGKSRRKGMPRRSQAEWQPAPNRGDPIKLLQAQDKGHIQELLPIKYGRMLASPFASYRGSAVVMASDLASTPISGLDVILCGDAHLSNFGIFATPECNLVFDINDFDEVYNGPWEWDVKRLVASFVIAGRSNGLKEVDNREAAMLAAGSYRLHMADYAKMDVLHAWYDFLNLEDIIANMQNNVYKKLYTKKLHQAADETVREIEFAKQAFVSGDKPRVIDQPPFIFLFLNM